MTLQRKIISSFVLSAVIVSAFVITSFVTLSDIRRDIRYIELTDSIRTKTLQLRRHEENFLLYREQAEIDALHQNLAEINALITEGRAFDDRGSIAKLEARTKRYSDLFGEIVAGIAAIENGIDGQGGGPGRASMMKAAFVERPLLTAGFIERSEPGLAALAPALRRLDGQMTERRLIGDEIIDISREIDRRARAEVDRSITVAATAALTIFPAFLIVGFAGLFFISRNVVRRLNILMRAAESTGRGDFRPIPAPRDNDEVGALMAAFDKMEADLRERDEEIMNKNEELFQSRKLASIGTLASGVAHELNNPLNNIYLSAQVLVNEIPEGSPPMVQETVEEIYSETLRVKRIVSDLLEFSRSKQPELAEVDTAGLVRGIVSQRLDSAKAAGVRVRRPDACARTRDGRPPHARAGGHKPRR